MTLKWLQFSFSKNSSVEIWDPSCFVSKSSTCGNRGQLPSQTISSTNYDRVGCQNCMALARNTLSKPQGV